MSTEEKNTSVEQEATSPLCMPVKSASSAATVEVAPGIMVSQHLIDEAVKTTSGDQALADDYVDQIERQAEARARDRAELKADISASQQVVKEMFERLRNPLDPREKYVSYDSMPAPLQRVVKAYIDASAANAELDEAVKALQLSSREIVTDKA